jgi:hypothetical protein
MHTLDKRESSINAFTGHNVKDKPESSKKLATSETICVEQIWMEEFQDLSGTRTVRRRRNGRTLSISVVDRS